MAWYVVKRLHVPEGTIKFLERESIKMTQTMHLALEQYWAGLFSRTKSREVFEWYSAPAPVRRYVQLGLLKGLCHGSPVHFA